MPEPTQHHCSFCGKKGDEVLVLVAGPGEGLFICDECVKLCDGIVWEHRIRKAALELVAKTPVLAGGHFSQAGSATDA